MTKANGLDRALLHGLHQRLANRPEPVSDAALRAVVRVAQAYTQTSRNDDSVQRDAVEQFDEDSLALVEILTNAVLQLKVSDVQERGFQFG